MITPRFFPADPCWLYIKPVLAKLCEVYHTEGCLTVKEIEIYGTRTMWLSSHSPLGAGKKQDLKVSVFINVFKC